MVNFHVSTQLSHGVQTCGYVLLKEKGATGGMAHSRNPSAREAEAGGLPVCQLSKTLSQDSKGAEGVAQW